VVRASDQVVLVGNDGPRDALLDGETEALPFFAPCTPQYGSLEFGAAHTFGAACTSGVACALAAACAFDDAFQGSLVSQVLAHWCALGGQLEEQAYHPESPDTDDDIAVGDGTAPPEDGKRHLVVGGFHSWS